jgi:hypothetical protein
VAAISLTVRDTTLDELLRSAYLALGNDSMYVRGEPAELAQRAELVIQAAGWFPGRRDDLAIALGRDPDLAGQLPEWLVNLILDLGHAGLGAEAAQVGDGLAQVDPESRAIYDADVAVALAEAGLAEQARDRIAANLTRWPDDFWSGFTPATHWQHSATSTERRRTSKQPWRWRTRLTTSSNMQTRPAAFSG